MKPPAEAKTEGFIWKLDKVAGGLFDASWQYLSVKEELCKLLCNEFQLDKAMFRRYANSNLESLFVMCVDEFLYARTENFKKIIITKIQENFKVGIKAHGGKL